LAAAKFSISGSNGYYLGKTRITIRLDNKGLDHFRKQVHEMGGGNYQTLINDAIAITSNAAT